MNKGKQIAKVTQGPVPVIAEQHRTSTLKFVVYSDRIIKWEVVNIHGLSAKGVSSSLSSAMKDAKWTLKNIRNKFFSE